MFGYQTAIATVTSLLDKNKAVAAALSSFVAGVGTLLTNWIVTGVWDGQETRLLVATFLTTIITTVATYLTRAGRAEVVIESGTLEIPEDDVEHDDGLPE